MPFLPKMYEMFFRFHQVRLMHSNGCIFTTNHHIDLKVANYEHVRVKRIPTGFAGHNKMRYTDEIQTLMKYEIWSEKIKNATKW